MERSSRKQRPITLPIYKGLVLEHEKFGIYEVLSVIGASSVILFRNTNSTAAYENSKVLNGSVRDRYARTVGGVGYLGNKVDNSHKFYHEIRKCWTNMIRRCYRNPTTAYENATVSEDWQDFSKFFEWAKDRYVEGYHIDKDILSKGAKHYSASTCIFVKPEVNYKEITHKNGICFVLSTINGPCIVKNIPRSAEYLGMHSASLYKLLSGKLKTCRGCCLIATIDNSEDFYANIT